MPVPAVFLSNPDGTVTGGGGKSTGDKVRLPMDMGNEPLIIGGARAVSQNVSISGSGAPTVSSIALDYYYQLSALFTGGSVGTYDAVYMMTLNDADGTIISRTGVVKVN